MTKTKPAINHDNTSERHTPTSTFNCEKIRPKHATKSGNATKLICILAYLGVIFLIKKKRLLKIETINVINSNANNAFVLIMIITLPPLIQLLNLHQRKMSICIIVGIYIFHRKSRQLITNRY